MIYEQHASSMIYLLVGEYSSIQAVEVMFAVLYFAPYCT